MIKSISLLSQGCLILSLRRCYFQDASCLQSLLECPSYAYHRDSACKQPQHPLTCSSPT